MEVHLSDDSGKIAGVNDKRCMILVEVSGLAANIDYPVIPVLTKNAVNDAILKLKMSLYATCGRLRFLKTPEQKAICYKRVIESDRRSPFVQLFEMQ
ncbi:MAG: hypothetical protein IPH20_26070 [Bacteroidales bacterium]|nr:hypothetical protein [Bacteroidales bacterium]